MDCHDLAAGAVYGSQIYVSRSSTKADPSLFQQVPSIHKAVFPDYQTRFAEVHLLFWKNEAACKQVLDDEVRSHRLRFVSNPRKALENKAKEGLNNSKRPSVGGRGGSGDDDGDDGDEDNDGDNAPRQKRPRTSKSTGKSDKSSTKGTNGRRGNGNVPSTNAVQQVPRTSHGQGSQTIGSSAVGQLPTRPRSTIAGGREHLGRGYNHPPQGYAQPGMYQGYGQPVRYQPQFSSYQPNSEISRGGQMMSTGLGRGGVADSISVAV